MEEHSQEKLLVTLYHSHRFKIQLAKTLQSILLLAWSKTYNGKGHLGLSLQFAITNVEAELI